MSYGLTVDNMFGRAQIDDSTRQIEVVKEGDTLPHPIGQLLGSNYTTGNILGQLPLWYLTNVHADDLPAQKAQIIIVISNCLQMFPNHFAVVYENTNTEEKSLFN